MSKTSAKASNRLAGAFSHPLATTTPDQPEPAVESPVEAVTTTTTDVPADGPAQPLDSQPETAAHPVQPGTGFVSGVGIGPEYAYRGRKRAEDLDNTQPVRMTVYLHQLQLNDLRREVVRRQIAGKRCDVSQLMREAVAEYLLKLDIERSEARKPKKSQDKV